MTSDEKETVVGHLEGLARIIGIAASRGRQEDMANLAVLANALDVLGDACDYAEARTSIGRATEMFRAGPLTRL